MLRIAIVTLAAVVSATLAPHGVRAQVVSLETLLTEADSANPRVAAARASADAAAARIPQAGVMPDPTLGLALMNIPVADPSLSREMMTMTQIQLGARLPWPDRLALGESIASSRSEAATWEVRRVRDEVRSEVSAAFHELYFVDRALEVTARNRELLADLADLTSSRYAVGDAGQPDVLRAQVELTRLTDQAVALRERRVSAVARLNTLVGRASDTPIPSVQIPEQIRRLATERA
ncbi:MAG TPA: TolC family protein, partial [Longimicrobiales bacterium]|nr:TolC family protein [Longimicrobiales bacterium]